MDPMKQLRKKLKQRITLSPEKRIRFFKVAPGDYAAHDQFLGITLPNLRQIAKEYKDLDIGSLQVLIQSKFNEERLLALIILVDRYKTSNNRIKHQIYRFYFKNLKYVNNWNLVDTSAHLIIGAQLLTARDKKILLTLAKSKNLWERRIAIVATWCFIRNQQFTWTLKLAKVLLKDPEDLIHKAVGWMLRELGKQNQQTLEDFLMQHATKMPRTMLRYAIERFPEPKRCYYLRLESH